MGRLLANELSKVFHRRSCRIMALLMLVIAIGTPVLSKLAYVMYDKPRDTIEKYYQIMYEQEKGARKEMYKAVLEDIAELKKNGIDIDGWRKDYFNYYLRYANTITALNLIQQGSNIEEVSGGMAYSPLIQRGLDGEYKFLHITEEHGLSGAGLEEVSFKKEDIPKYKEEVQVYYNKAKQLLYAGKAEFARLRAEEYNRKIADIKEQIKELGASESDIREREAMELAIVVYEGAVKCWEAFKTCDEKNEEWITDLEKLMSDLAQFGAYKAAAFDKEYFFSEDDRKYHFYRLVYFDRTMGFDSYEKYMEFMNEAKEDFRRAVDMIVYSAEKQAPTAASFNASFKSAKYALDLSLTTGLYTVMSFCIFLSAVIMGSEYTTGSIRLLLIRPQPRWKIPLSKLLCLWIFTAAALIVIYTVTPLTTVVIYGGGDLETKITVFKNGTITAVYPLQNAIHKGLLGFISMFGISMLTFMLSLIIKKGTISAAVGIMVFGFGQSIAAFARVALYRMPFLKYTVLPYIMNLEYAEYNPLDRFLMSFDYTPVSAEYGLELSTGIVIIMLLTAIFVMLSFVIFDRQQIKN